jgi:hypothetical protein
VQRIFIHYKSYKISRNGSIATLESTRRRKIKFSAAQCLPVLDWLKAEALDKRETARTTKKVNSRERPRVDIETCQTLAGNVGLIHVYPPFRQISNPESSLEKMTRRRRTLPISDKSYAAHCPD